MALPSSRASFQVLPSPPSSSPPIAPTDDNLLSDVDMLDSIDSHEAADGLTDEEIKEINMENANIFGTQNADESYAGISGDDEEEKAIEVYRDLVHGRFPWFTPRNDMDVMFLAGVEYPGKADQKECVLWIDKEIETMAAYMELTTDQVWEGMRPYMDAPSAEIIGAKPRRNMTCWLAEIPNSSVTIRFWPSARQSRLFGIDFISTMSKQPVETPKNWRIFTLDKASSISVVPSLEEAFFPGVSMQGKSQTYVVKEGSKLILHTDTTQPGMGFDFIVPQHPHVIRNELQLVSSTST